MIDRAPSFRTTALGAIAAAIGARANAAGRSASR